MTPLQSPFAQFFDQAGAPLSNGSIFVGAAGQNPETAPITVYYDEAGTQPAAQPIRTMNGYPVRSGTPAAIFLTGDYSLTVKDSAGRLVVYQPRAAGIVTGSDAVVYQHPGTGSVPRTLASKLADVVFAEDFRRADDADDAAAIQRILDQGLYCGLRAGKTYYASGLIARANTGIVCVGGRAIIRVPTGVGAFGLHIDVDRFTLTGVNFDGGDTTDFKSFPSASIGTRCGVIVGAPFATGRNLNEVSLSDCDFYGFDKAGLWGREVMAGATLFGKKTSLHNLSAYRCFYGLWADQRFEYCCFTNCYAYECRTGIYNQGGNNSFSACQSNWCYDNFMLEYGDNDGHGQAVGCSFNHAYGGHNIFAKNIGNGFTFVGCSMWFGNIEIFQSYGISITQSVIANLDIKVTGGGVNNVDNNYFVVAVSKTFVGYCFTTFRNNRDTYQATSELIEATYPDLWMIGKTSTAVGTLRTNTAAAELNLTYDTKKWMGKDLAELGIYSSRAVIQKTGLVRTSVHINFTTAAAAQTVRFNIVKYGRDIVTRKEVLSSGVYCPASTAGLSLSRSVEWEFLYGEQIAIELWTTSATGFTLDAIDVRHALTV